MLRARSQRRQFWIPPGEFAHDRGGRAGSSRCCAGLEVSRLARNNSDWYRLLELCGVTNTLIGDTAGINHSGLFNDRLMLGLKWMSEAELHVLRATARRDPQQS